MLRTIIAAACIGLILLVSEYLWQKAVLYGERARKFVHILAGSFVAFLPFWVPYKGLTVLAIGFVAANLINHFTRIFHAIYAIERKSIGDILLGVTVLICALLRPDPWLFAAVILHVSLADGLGALAGKTYAKKPYTIFNNPKTLSGTLVFFMTSLAIVLVTFGLRGFGLSPALFVIPAVATILENISGYGTDNVTVPLSALWLMSLLK